MKVCSVCQQCYDESDLFCTEVDHPTLSELHSRDRECVDGYRLERLLETRAVSETYLAQHTASGRSCVIRFLRSSGRDDQFLRETQIASTLFHPNVADIYEAGALENGELFVVSEDTTTGRTLRTMLEMGGAVKLRTAIRL